MPYNHHVVAVPRYAQSVERIRIEATARLLAADLEYARNRAKLSGTTQTVSFLVASNEYSLPGLMDLDHPDQPFQVRLDSA